MFEQVLQLLCVAVKAGATIFTPHAQDEMNEDDLFIFDLEQCVLTGTIIERQWDDMYEEWKYVVQGESADGEEMVVIVKLDHNGKTVFITTWRL